MPLSYLPLRWESTGDQWWFATPIDWAAAKGHYDLVRELLSLDTNLLIKLTSLRRIRRLETVWDDEDESNTIAKNRSIVAQNLFLECEPNKTRKAHNTLIRAGYGGWLLYTACSAADVAFVQKLLRIDSSLVFGEGEYGVTDILYAAARSKDSGVFRFLLDVSGSQREIEGKADENRLVFRSEMMNRAAHAAARGGNVEMLREIIGNNSGDVLGFRDAQGSTVLHSASARGQVEVVKILIATHDIITSTDNQGNTALHVAAYRGHLAVVKVLLSFSPSIISITNNYGDTFLHMIIAGFRSPGFRRVDHQNELMKEVIKGKYINIEDMINARNNNGRTALHMAVNMNIKSEIVELLMSVFGINVNIRDNNGMTPLDLLKQGPKSASSEILIRRLISAGGISKSEDRVVRNALVSHLKMNGIGASPGTSFRVSDSEIFLYAGLENEIKPVDSEIIENTDFSDLSGEISKYNSPIRIKTPSSSDNAKMRLKRVFWSKKRDKNDDSGSSLGDDSESSPTPSPIPLRKRFTKQISLPNSESVTPLRNSIPSPSTKKMVPAQLMHSPLSDSSRASPISNSSGKQRSLLGKVIEKSTFSNLSFRVEKSREIKKNASFDRKLMNRYLCFGSHGLPLEDTIGGDGAHKSYNPSSSIMT